MAKKPSLVANLILFLIILVPVVGLGFLGWWGFKKFSGGEKKEAQITASAPTPTPTPTPPSPTPEPTPPTPTPTPPVPEPVKPVVMEPVKPDPVPTPIPPPEPVKPVVVTPEPPPPEPVKPVVVAPEPIIPTPPPLPEPMKPVITPEPPPVVAEVETAPPAGSEKARSFTVFAVDSPEGKALLEDAERRIQEAPKEIYTENKKMLVRRGLRSAKSLARVTTVYYGNGSTQVGPKAEQSIKDALGSEEVKNLLKDPRAVMFVIGFSDPSGSADTNQNLAKLRAEGVKKLLQDGKVVKNDIHSIGIGSTEVISEANKDKNRASEVWIVMQ